MAQAPTPEMIRSLFASQGPEGAWLVLEDIVAGINPRCDLAMTRAVFNDVMRLFDGEYPGYQPIKTPYHDRAHTLDVLVCAARLLHGAHLAGHQLSDRDVNLALMAALFHDVGYARVLEDDTGTGAQYTRTHVGRGILFMRDYMLSRGYPADLVYPLETIILCTSLDQCIATTAFPCERTRLLGRIIGTADLVGQMADRTYLEKLLFLYMEFSEAGLGDYSSAHDLLRRTIKFYDFAWHKLDKELDATYAYLADHFRHWFGVSCNFYQEAIEKNIAYLSSVLQLSESEYLQKLKRGGIVERAVPALASMRQASPISRS